MAAQFTLGTGVHLFEIEIEIEFHLLNEVEGAGGYTLLVNYCIYSFTQSQSQSFPI